MAIANINDAHEVDDCLTTILDATDQDRCIVGIRRLFVEVLDFEPDNRPVSLGAASDPALPDDAWLVAQRDDVHVVYIPLTADRVTNRAATATARLLRDLLGEDLLLLFTAGLGDQLHTIHPSFAGARPTLKRMVARRGEHRRTVVQQIANMWNDYGRLGKSIHEAIREAFRVEPVTKAFFQAYRDIFQESESKIMGFGSDRCGREDRHHFTQTMFNRLMFVYFLSRKGWLSFNGETDYLNALWKDYQHGLDHNFYNDRLAPLFFAGLNNPQSRDLSHNNPTLHALIGDVPFLNGGLFEKNDFDKRNDEFKVPDDAIEPILRDLFDQFNFTVMESTPYDTEVAVDPEMLGKVFEELVAERHESGAYYTPRPVVAFMCREALKGYLEGQSTGLTTEAIADFVDQQSTDGISVADARRIANALEEITVVDPACGSGAYLLGMMQELTELQTALYNVGVDSKAIYDLKLEIIQRNLYGVDIDEFAVNIAMLRLWLSLSIDYDGKIPEPLPNLDFKIVKGDSLFGADPSSHSYVGLAHDLVQRLDLAGLKADYMRATQQTDKDRLRAEILGVEEQVASTLGDAAIPGGVIDWRVDFGEVFTERGGFDIVVANPPYGITISDQRSKAIGNSNSYTNFMARAVEIAPAGVLAYITPTSWETGERFKKFRQYLFNRIALQNVVNLPYDVFDTPYVDTAITVGSIGNVPRATFGIATLEKREEINLAQIGDYLEQVGWSVVAKDSGFRVPQLGWAGNLFGRVAANATPLSHLASSKRGIESYKFDIFEHQPEDGLPFFNGQVQRYKLLSPSKYAFVVVNPRDRPFHHGPRILTRRIVSRANRLMSTHTDDEFVVKKDIYVIKPKSREPHVLEMLLAILNSSLLSFLYLSRSAAATKDDFRQVTLTGLRELPIIFPNTPSAERQLVQLVLDREIQGRNAEDLDQRIDEVVYQMYGITEEEQNAISAYLKRSG